MSEDHKSQSGIHSNTHSGAQLRYDHTIDGNHTKVENARLTRPNKYICKITAEFVNGTKYGTGWMAGKQLVITAAHVLYNPTLTRNYPIKITIEPALSGTEVSSIEISDSSQIKPIDAVHLSSIAPKEMSLEDYAAIELPIELNIGSFGYRDISGVNLTNIETSGYPRGRLEHGKYQRQSRGHVDIADGFLSCKTYTEDGCSGSPVWITENNGNFLAVGIHICGATSGNLAIPISKQVEDFIDKFQK